VAPQTSQLLKGVATQKNGKTTRKYNSHEWVAHPSDLPNQIAQPNPLSTQQARHQHEPSRRVN
jgi:hypothetical protein